MRILFDNNGFADLVQQPKHQTSLHKLRELVSKKKLAVIGCCTLLQELAGLAQKDIQLYLKTLSEYKKITQGKILQPASQLLIGEGRQLRPIDYQASLMDVQPARNIVSNMKVASNAEGLFSEAAGLKQGYSTVMESARIEVLMTPKLVDEPNSSISSGYREWFNKFPTIVQSWFVDIFKPNSEFSVGQLPHVSAFLGYALTRIYESNVFNIKDRDNDLFDRAYFTDAAVVDVLITNDRSFSRTALRVPSRTFEVLSLDELVALIEKQAPFNQ